MQGASRSEFQTISKKLIQSRGECEICGRKLDLEVHHIQPVALGGTNDTDNLQVLCRYCHMKRPSHREATKYGISKARSTQTERLISAYEFYKVLEIMLRGEKIVIDGFALNSADPFDIIDFLMEHRGRRKSKTIQEIDEYYANGCINYEKT